ncbi:MAG: hypothetical protein ACI9Y1_000790 [Lentisphaeria bacterium]
MSSPFFALNALPVCDSPDAQYDVNSRAFCDFHKMGGKYTLRKRILEDHWMSEIVSYYEQAGWVDNSHSEIMESLNSGEQLDDLIFTRDGFVVSEDIEDQQLEELLGEYYDNSGLIDEMRSAKLPRGLLFGNLLEGEALRESIPLLLIAARQFTIKQILHGLEPQNQVTKPIDKSGVTTIGEYIDSLYHERVIASSKTA